MYIHIVVVVGVVVVIVMDAADYTSEYSEGRKAEGGKKERMMLKEGENDDQAGETLLLGPALFHVLVLYCHRIPYAVLVEHHNGIVPRPDGYA